MVRQLRMMVESKTGLVEHINYAVIDKGEVVDGITICLVNGERIQMIFDEDTRHYQTKVTSSDGEILYDRKWHKADRQKYPISVGKNVHHREGE